MPEEPPPWWYESDSDIALQMREGFARVTKQIDLVFGVSFTTPSTSATDTPAINFRIGGIPIGKIERYPYGYVVRWDGPNIRSAYMSWIGALRGGPPPVYIDGGGVAFQDVEAAKTAVVSFLAYFVSDRNLGSLRY